MVTSTPLVGTGGHVKPDEGMELSTIPAATSSKVASSRAKKVTKLGTPVITSLTTRLEDHQERQRYNVHVCDISLIPRLYSMLSMLHTENWEVGKTRHLNMYMYIKLHIACLLYI